MNFKQLITILARFKTSGYLVSAAGVISSRLAQIVVQVTLARLLTGQDYSLFFFYYSAVTGLSVFIGDAIGLASSRALSTNAGTRPEMKSTAAAAGLAVSLLGGLLLVVHTHFLSDEPTSLTLLGLLIFYAINLSFSSVLQYITISLDQRNYLAKVQISFAIVSVLSATWAAIYFGWEAALGCLLGSVFLFNLFLLFRSFAINRIFGAFKNNLTSVLGLIRSALPIGGSMMLGGPVHVYCLSVLRNSTPDRPSELGVFGIAFVTFTLVSFLPAAFGQFLVPWLLKNQKLSTQNAFLYLLKLYLVAGSLILVFIISANLFGLEKLIPTLAHAQNTIYLLAAAGFVAGFITLYSFFLNAIDKSKLVFFSYIYHSISYVLLTYVFVKYLNWGAAGLASAILLTSIAQLLILSFIKRRTEHEKCKT